MTNVINLNLDTLSAHSLTKLNLLLIEEAHERLQLSGAVPEGYERTLEGDASNFFSMANSCTTVREAKIALAKESREKMNAALTAQRERTAANRDAELATNVGGVS